MNFYNLGYRIIGSSDGAPFPPADLVNLVIGTKTVAWYQLGGLFAHESIVSFLWRNGVNINSLHSIYDFGCGCGRIIRYFAGLKDHCEIWGTDYNPDLVNWCDKHLAGFAKFKINKANPPLDFEDSKFDLVYAYSVFTHTRRNQQMDWLKELARVTTTNGYVFLTTQGQRVAARQGFPQHMLDDLNQEGIYAAGEEHSGSNGCSVFHTDMFFRSRQQATGLELVAFMEGGARDTCEHDFYLFRKVGA